MAFVNTYTVANTVNSTDNTIGLSGTDMRLFNFTTIENSRNYARTITTLNTVPQVLQVGGINTGLSIGTLGNLAANEITCTRITIGQSEETDISNNAIGFMGTAAAQKITVLGSRGGNAALANLLDALATYGLITNNTTA